MTAARCRRRPVIPAFQNPATVADSLTTPATIRRDTLLIPIVSFATGAQEAGRARILGASLYDGQRVHYSDRRTIQADDEWGELGMDNIAERGVQYE